MITDLLSFALTVFTGFFAVMNPLANTPVFLGLTDGYPAKEKKQIAKTSAFTAFMIVAVSVVLGKYIFELFEITIPAFKITGGVLLFIVGFGMLQSKKAKIHSINQNSKFDDSIAISPLAIPILAGPGTIVTAMNNVTSGNYIHIAIILLVFAFMCYATYLAFSLSDLIVEKLGNNIIIVFGKIMGLILAIMGTDMMITGIKLAFNI